MLFFNLNMSKSYFILPCLFFAILLAPICDSILKLDKTANRENRNFAKYPTLTSNNISNYPKELNNYLTDNFGFRKLLIECNGNIKKDIFKTGSKKHIVFGKDGWLFLSSSSGEGDLMFNDYTHRNLLSQNKLDKVCKIYKSRYLKLDRQRIKYYRGFYPNKHTIYPEMLPLRAQYCKIGDISLVDQVIDKMKEDYKIEIIDFREDLFDKKDEFSLYLKGDTHWNEMGAFIAYRKLIKTLSKDFPSFQPNGFNQYNIKWNHTLGEWKRSKDKLCKVGCYDEYNIGYDNALYCPQGLVKMLGLDGSKFLDSIPIFISKQPIKAKKISEVKRKHDRNQEVFMNPDKPQGITAIVFRDSYTLNLIKFLYPHFKKIIFIKGQFSMKQIRKHNPDIVLDFHVERNFAKSTNSN